MTEQLQLFPTDESRSMTLEDDITTTPERMTEILRSLGDSFEAAMEKRVDVATFNYLMGFGMPSRPSEVRYMLQQTTAVMLAWLVANGYISLNDTAVASEEELAARPADAVSAFEEVEDDEAKVIMGNFGQYL